MSAAAIAGIGLTHLRVYDQRLAPDGTHSGCAHVHAVTDEGYYVIVGEGAIELHDLEQGYRRVPLVKGDYVQFGPGTLHRSVSTSGLEVLAVIGNAGLAEHGDARIYFGRAVDDDPARFAELVALPRAHGLDGALARRDASAVAHAALLGLWEEDREAYRAELARFVACHRAAVRARVPAFRDAVREGPERFLRVVQARLERLAQPDEAPPQVEGVRHAAIEERYGMCGLLRPLVGLTPV